MTVGHTGVRSCYYSEEWKGTLQDGCMILQAPADAYRLKLYEAEWLIWSKVQYHVIIIAELNKRYCSWKFLTSTLSILLKGTCVWIWAGNPYWTANSLMLPLFTCLVMLSTATDDRLDFVIDLIQPLFESQQITEGMPSFPVMLREQLKLCAAQKL